MNKEKQIEELANIIYKRVNTLEHFGLGLFGLCEKIAEELLKHYQPKIPEDSVVLTREEFDEFRKDQAEVKFLKKQITDQIRKETAREFAEKIQDYLNDKVCEEFGDSACDITYFTIDVDKVISDVFELARQYKVEVE